MFEPFQKFLKQASSRYGITTEMRAAQICHHFRIITPEIFKGKDSPELHIKPAHFKDKTLTISVETPAWAQEVIMRKEKIIEEINKKEGEKIIQNLRTQLSREASE